MICQMKTESKWSLYRHITPSGKVYIGITSQKPEYRWNNGNGYLNSRKTKLKSSIIKYGWDNIKHEVLFTNLDEDTAKRLEVELIRHYKNLGISLNHTDGGEGVKGITPWNKGIKRYNSATEAAIELDIDISYLNKCCRLSKVCKGYRFVRI